MERGAHRWLIAAAAAAFAHCAAAASARALGFDSISDDDHARVVLAQAFAASPRLDPTGSSWLPAPFWAYGALLALLGKGLAVARAAAVAAAASSGALLVAAARCAGLDPARALLASLLSLSLPMVALLGAAPVPELPVAAAVAFSLAHLASPAEPPPARWWAAASLLLLASLSRYEAWSAALFFSAVAALRARRRPWLWGPAALASSGAVLWILWNFHAHGHPLAFARRVASYRQGLGVISEGLGAYPGALLREGALIAAAAALAARQNPSLRLAAAGALWVVAALSIAEARGGAPTHHPERALLGPLLALLIVAFAGLEGRLRVALVAASLAWGAARLRPTLEGLGQSRAPEVALGQALGSALAPGQRALLVATSYGFFAVDAALARPGALIAVVPRSVDPRSKIEGDPLRDGESLQELLAAHPEASWLLLLPGQAPWLAARPGEVAAAGGRLVPF